MEECISRRDGNQAHTDYCPRIGNCKALSFQRVVLCVVLHSILLHFPYSELIRCRLNLKGKKKRTVLKNPFSGKGSTLFIFRMSCRWMSVWANKMNCGGQIIHKLMFYPSQRSPALIRRSRNDGRLGCPWRATWSKNLNWAFSTAGRGATTLALA